MVTLDNLKGHVYLDPASKHNIMDDTQYDKLTQRITMGIYEEAQILTPEDLDHTEMGIPITMDTTRDGHKIVWISKWVRINM